MTKRASITANALFVLPNKRYSTPYFFSFFVYKYFYFYCRNTLCFCIIIGNLHELSEIIEIYIKFEIIS